MFKILIGLVLGSKNVAHKFPWEFNMPSCGSKQRSPRQAACVLPATVTVNKTLGGGKNKNKKGKKKPLD
jgi:hypothetical protein